jgi:K+-sensing histidine kinase KdpD
MAGGIESVRIEVADDLGDLWAPRDHVSHVVRNLLRNAVQALNGRVDSRIEVGRVPGKSYSFFVRDNGPGVPYEEQTRIFEAFRRGPRSGPNNMGLGLALVQQLVEQNGGEVWVNSAPGEGATFCVALPPPPAAPESTVAPADRTVSACQLPRGTEDSTKSRERIHRSASMIQGRSASDSETDLGAKVEGMIA